MTNKKVLVTAIALATSQGALGATWSSDLGHAAVEHTAQGIAKTVAADGAATTAGVLTLGAVYAANDTITFTYNVAKAANYNWPTSINSMTSGTALATLEIDIADLAGVSRLQLKTVANGAAGQTGVVVGDRFTIENDSTTTTYHITDLAPGGANAGEVEISPVLAENTTDADDVTFQQLKTVELGLVNSTDTSATYRVITIGATGTSVVGAELPVPAPSVDPTALTAAGSATVSVASATGNGTAMDTLATTLTIATVSEEFAFTATAADAVIDVEADKKTFASGGDDQNAGIDDPTKQDQIVLTLTQDAGTAGNSITTTAAGVVDLTNSVPQVVTTADKATTVITADYSFMDSDAATAGVQESAQAVMCDNSTDDVNVSGTELTLVDADPVQTQTCYIGNDQAAAMSPTTFSGTTTVTYTSEGTAGETQAYTTALGSWTLNGASINVYGVPFGTTTSRFITVGNKGAGSAVVSATVEYDGTSYGPYTLGTLASKTSSAMGPAIDSALAGAGVTMPDNSRAMVTLSSPTKANDITVTAAYKAIADGDRLALPTSDEFEGANK